MNKLAVGSMAVAVLALVLACVALVGASRDDELGGRIDELGRDMQSLNAALAELSSGTDTRATRAREAPPPAAEVDRAEFKRIIDKLVDERVGERVREAVALATGKARLQPGMVPRAIRDVVAGILGDARITRAEQRGKDGRTYFRLRAELDGEQYDARIWSDGEIIEAEMPPDCAPEVVKAAAARTVEGIRLTQVRRDIDNDRPIYDIEGRFDGEKYDMKMTLDGKIIEAEMPPDCAPEVVKTAAARTVEGIRLTQVRREIDNDRPVYDIEGRFDGEKYDMKITPDGQVVEAELWPGGVTRALRDVAAKVVAGIKLTDAKIETDEGRAIYELEGEVGRDDYRIRLTLDGRPIEVDGPDGEVKFDAVPEVEPGPAPEPEVPAEEGDGVF